MQGFFQPGPFEAMVVAFIVCAFVAWAAATLKARHRDVGVAATLIGASVYGAVVGAVIAFLVLPLRVTLINGDLPEWMAAVGGIGVFLTMFSLRRGLVGRLPFLGPHVRAYRRAQLRRTIETAEKDLRKLTVGRWPEIADGREATATTAAAQQEP
ncbi:MAG: hypothetical protein GC152_05505 [Alphaproteobacteria bacterium]|nr:hypothetical protein [Alphaproteobacteria bacterium]